MRIVDLKTFVVNANIDNWVFVKIYTDEGITGVGESSVEGREATIAQAIEELKRYLIGKDPFDVEDHWHRLYRNMYWGQGAVLCGSLSAVDGALWDIKGKALGVPVYQLLGGKCRDRIRVYANRWFFGARDPRELAAQAVRTVEQGYRALKWDPFGKAEGVITSGELRKAVMEIDTVRRAVGDEVDLLIEGHGRFGVSSAVQVAKAIEEFQPMLFEEPVLPGNMAALAEVRAKSHVPIAAGERFYTKYAFREALDLRAIDIAQPDLRETGGILEAKKIAAMAEAWFVPVAPHNIHGPVGTAMSLHLAAAIPNFLILEYSVEEVSWKAELVGADLTPQDGYITLPTAPGLGVDLDEDLALAHPFRYTNMVDSLFA